MLRDGHSSGPRITAGSSDLPGGCGAPSRHASSLRRNPSLFGLAPCGVCPAAALLRRRCALTAPFHPYLSLAARAVCFLWHFPSNRFNRPSRTFIRHTALRSSDFPLSCVLQQRPSGPAANYFIIVHAEVQAESLAGRQLCSYSCGFGASSSGYSSRATPINSGISPTR